MNTCKAKTVLAVNDYTEVEVECGMEPHDSDLKHTAVQYMLRADKSKPPAFVTYLWED